jgi:hypothetical protein
LGGPILAGIEGKISPMVLEQLGCSRALPVAYANLSELPLFWGFYMRPPSALHSNMQGDFFTKHLLTLLQEIGNYWRWRVWKDLVAECFHPGILSNSEFCFLYPRIIANVSAALCLFPTFTCPQNPNILTTSRSQPSSRTTSRIVGWMGETFNWRYGIRQDKKITNDYDPWHIRKHTLF